MRLSPSNVNTSLCSQASRKSLLLDLTFGGFWPSCIHLVRSSILLSKVYFFIGNVDVSPCAWVPSEVMDSLALELQVITNLLTWLLRTKRGSSVKAGGTLNHPAVVSSSQAFTTKIRDWRDNSVVKSTGRSSRGPGSSPIVH